MIDILISGFYGFSNSGDEAVLQSMVELLKKNRPDITIGALTKQGKSIYVEGIEPIHRTNIFQIIRILKKCKLFISGGGSLIQDVTSSRSLYYYLGLILLARWMGKKVMLYANGIGPVSGAFNRWLCKHIIDGVDLITLREPDSLEELKSMGITKTPCHVSADPAIEILPANGEEVSALKQELGLSEEKPVVCISVRKWQKYTNDMITALAQTADRLTVEKKVQVLLLPLHFSEDYVICKRVQEKMTQPCIIAEKNYKVPEMLGLIQCARAMVGMRLHSLIYAASFHIPVVGIVYDTKVKAFLQYVNQPFMEPVEQLSSDKLYEKICTVLEQSPKIENELSSRMEELRKLTKQDARMAIAFLEE